MEIINALLNVKGGDKNEYNDILSIIKGIFKKWQIKKMDAWIEDSKQCVTY